MKYQKGSRDNMINQSASLAIAIAAIGTVGTVAAGAIGYQSGSKAVDKDYVTLAISNLEKKDVNPELRKWSVDVLSKLSPVPFGQKLKKELTESGIYRERIIFSRLNVPPQLRERCPDLLKGSGREVSIEVANKLLKEYEYCRIRLDSMIQLIEETNKITDEANAKSKKADDDLMRSLGGG